MSLDGSLAEARSASIGPSPDERPASRIGDRLPDLGLITLHQLEVASCEQKRSGRMLGDGLADVRDAAESGIVEGAVGSRPTAPAALEAGR